jgi:copper(I)-binding protein
MRTRHENSRRRVWAQLLAASALALISPAFAVRAPSPSPVRITEAWVRWLPAGLPAAAYVTIVNAGMHPVNLVGATSPAYSEVSLHQTASEGGSMQMVAIERITIAPHATLRFEESGYHFMLTGPKQPIKPGDHVPLTLAFADSTSVTLSFEVRKPDGSAAADAGTTPNGA